MATVHNYDSEWRQAAVTTLKLGDTLSILSITPGSPAGKARRYYALTFPHDRWYMQAQTWWQNRHRRRAGNQFRTFIHPVAQIHSVLQQAGLEVRISRQTLGWVVLVCTRPTAPDVAFPRPFTRWPSTAADQPAAN